MRIGCISDTHNWMSHVELLESCDVLLHAGDLTMDGTPEEIRCESARLGRLPVKHKLLIAGNHDWLFQRNNAKAREIVEGNGITYLQDSGVVIDGIKFWGSPWQPWFFDWAFNLQRGKPLKEKWDLVPKDTDVLITHGPPLTILDMTTRGEEVGCRDLLKTVMDLDLKLHAFGHIHGQRGFRTIGKTKFVSSSICDEHYDPVNKPQYFNIAEGA